MNLNKLVKIRRRTTTQDAAGQVRETWQTIGEVWASLRPLSGREYYSASGERSEITHEIIIRYGLEVLSKDRLEVDGRAFDVVTPINIGEQNRYYKLIGKENGGV